MKKFISIYFFLCAMMALSGAKAQEFIDSIGFPPYSESHVLSINTNSWIYHAYNDTMKSSFAKRVSSNVSFPTISQLPFSVNEMAYTFGTVFFGGIKANPFWGYFSISGFPNTPVYTVEIPWLKPMDNIDAFRYASVSNYYHVVLTSETLTNNSNCIIDAKKLQGNTGAWEVTTATNNGIDIYYRDVTVTNNYVVTTGNVSEYNDGYIVAFQKEQSHQGGFLYSNGKYIKTAQPPYDDNILIKHGKGDTVFVAYKSSANGKFIVEEFKISGNAPNISIAPIIAKEYTPALAAREPYLELKDITFRNVDNTVDVLMWWSNNSTSIVWNISHAQLVSGGAISGCGTNGILLQSIDAVQSTNSITVGSGQHLPGRDMRFCQLKKNFWFCTNQYGCNASTVTNNSDQAPFQINTETVTLYPTEETKTVTTVSASVICAPNLDNEEQ